MKSLALLVVLLFAACNSTGPEPPPQPIPSPAVPPPAPPVADTSAH